MTHYLMHHEESLVELNTLVANSDFKDLTLIEIIEKTQQKDQETSQKSDHTMNRIYCLASEHYSHSFFWNILKSRPKEDRKGSDVLIHKIIHDFKSIENFKRTFEVVCTDFFGSGWVWTVLDLNSNKVRIWSCVTGSPLQEKGFAPLFCLDIWEHAYYVDYTSNRGAYIQNFWKCLDWAKVSQIYENILRTPTI